jgi:hypothetical protein
MSVLCWQRGLAKTRKASYPGRRLACGRRAGILDKPGRPGYFVSQVERVRRGNSVLE